MSYQDIINKYASTNAAEVPPQPIPTPTPVKKVSATPVPTLNPKLISASPLNAPKATGYEGIVQKYAQSERQAKETALQTQTKTDVQQIEHPGFFASAKDYIKGFFPAAKQVITAPFVQPKETAFSVAAGLADLGPTITRAIKGIQGTIGIQPKYQITPLPNPGETEIGKMIADKIKQKFNIKTDSELQNAIRQSTTLTASYELGGGAVRGLGVATEGTVLSRVLGNVVGGQLTNESSSVKERSKQAAFDAAFGLATEGVMAGVKKLFRKTPIPTTEVPTPEAPVVAGEVPKPTIEKLPLTTTPKEPPMILYKPKDSLGKDLSGEPVLAKTEVDSKTGRAIVYYDKSLDTNLELKSQVMDHEYGHIVDKRLSNKGTNISAELPNYKGNKLSLDQVIGDFAKSQNKPAWQIATDLNVEINSHPGSNPAEKFANAVADYVHDPAAMKAKSPTFAAFMEHKLVQPRISENITTAKTLKNAPGEVPGTSKIETSTQAPEAPVMPPEVAKPGKISLKEQPVQPEQLPNIEPKKFTPEEISAKIDQTKTEIDLAEQTLDSSPAKNLVKYGDSLGNLKEVTGKGKGKFAKTGDQIITQQTEQGLGFKDLQEAEKAYEEYVNLRNDVQDLKSKLKELKQTKIEDYTPTQLDRINKLAQEAVTTNEKMQKSKFFAGTGLTTGKNVTRTSFNPKSINAPEETAKLFEDMGAENKQFATQRISKSNEAIKDLARLTGLTPEDLIKAKPGSIANAETVAAARQLVLDKAQELMNYLKGVDISVATSEELKAIKDRVIKLVAMQKAVAGLRTEASNVFRQFGIELMPGENATLSELGKALKERAKELNFDPAQADVFAGKVAKEINLTTKQKIGQGVLSTWYASILSGPKTTVRNILSTSANILTDLASKAANPRSWPEIPAAVSGLFKGLAQGLEEGKAVLKGEVYNGKFMGTGHGATRPEIFTGKWRTYGNVVESVGRFLNAQDKLLAAGAREMERASLKARGIILEKPIEDALTRAYAESTVYHGQPKGRFISALRDSAQTLRSKFPESKIIIPFVDTVANVMDRQFDYMPIFSYFRLRDSTILRQVERIAKDYNITSEIDKTAIKMRLRDQQIGRAVLGTAVSGAAVALAAAGRISGTGPTNVNERNQLQDTGWRPNSVKFGDTWIPYINLGPLAGIFAMAGNIHDKIKYDNAPTKDLYSLIGNGLVGWTQTQLNQSFLSGVSDVLDVARGGVSPESYFKKLGAGLVPIPATYTQIHDMIARQQYETRTIQEKIALKLGLTGGLQPRLNAMGQPTQGDLIYGVSPSTETHDPVYDFLTKNELVVAKPGINQQYVIPGTKNKRSFTPEEYTQYIQESGTEIYNTLKPRIAGYDKYPDEEKKKIVSKIVDDIRSRIRMKILYKR